MPSKNWKHPPQSMQEAIEACINHALTKHRITIERIAADMGLANKWILYKWIESGRLPAVLIRPFELACRCDYVTAFLAHAAHRLLINIPSGRLPAAVDLQAVSIASNEALGSLMNFALGKMAASEVISAVTAAMEHLAYQRENVARATQPELELEGDE